MIIIMKHQIFERREKDFQPREVNAAMCSNFGSSGKKKVWKNIRLERLESRSSLNFVQTLFSQLPKLRTYYDDLLCLNSQYLFPVEICLGLTTPVGVWWLPDRKEFQKSAFWYNVTGKLIVRVSRSNLHGVRILVEGVINSSQPQRHPEVPHP